MSATASPEFTPVFAPDPLLHDLLAVSLTAINLLRPCYSPTGELDDFAPEYFNPAAQRMTGLPERPGGTARTLFPDIFQNGIFAFYRQVFATGKPGEFELYYQADGLDNYFRIAARRSGERLLVSFTDTADQPRTAAENALRDSQATEQQARATAEQQRNELAYVVARAPVAMGLLRGPDFLIELANTRMGQLWGRPVEQLLGRPHFEALPDLAGQGFEQVLHDVLTTGRAYEQWEQPIQIAQPGQLYQAYLNIAYLPEYDASGQPTGVLIYATDVTEQVRTRHQVQTLNEELAALNEELRASNKEYQQANAVLSQTQQQLEAARAEAEAERQRLYQVLMRMPANIALLRGPEHVYDLVNAEYEHLFPARTTLGRSIRDVIPELDGQGFYELLDRVYETGEPFYQAETEAWADYAGTGTPQRRYYRTTFEPIRNAQGQVTEVLNFAVDITAQVEARQQVEQLNQELEARVQARTQEALALQAELLAAAQRQVQTREAVYQVFEQTTVAVALLRGPHHRYEYVNPAYRGFAPHRPLVGGTIAEELPELYAQGFGALLDQVYQTGETYVGVELPFTPAPRLGEAPRTSYFNFTYQAYYEAGQMIGVTIIALDVTEQVLARQERETQRQQLEQLFRQAPTPIVILDGPDLVFQLVNPAYQRIFPGRALADKPLLEALPELVGTPIPDLFRRVYQTGEPVTVQELPLWMARHEGHAPEEIYWTFTYQARRTAHGLIDGVRVFAHDVTEQVRTRQRIHELNEELAAANQELAAINEELTATNEELNDSNTQLQRTNVDLDTFVYTASHDLKAPITNIESITLALRSTLPPAVQQDEVVQHLLGLLDTTVARFQFTIGQLTDISRLQLAHAGPAEPVQLAQVVENVRLDLVPAMAAAGTQLTIEVAPELVVSFSPANLRSIVYNLLSNAIKYRAPDRPSQVRVRAEQMGATVVLTVQDNGLGMSELQQRQLFGLFQRLHTHVEGTGVGLYISKRLVENAGGTITVQSRVDAGTTFTVTFPA
ncbi:PAS domain-containing protein [Hymenobacter sp. YC55]|uniref:PAS domain-containing sensor histidine kinase n=1 Tax=Hymenobacter sp. YC55 TaxID=3034019 RepID=UPI0023FA0DF6|nr:PAS domain-containing protein [Hymenobacter sp. YC55]MDF7815928.1 PAS domain-containing protein [Hymenobacter sp. YC55]